jgi:hypothetical protein
MPSFCGSCGSPLIGQAGFCGSCGTRAGGAPADRPFAVAAPPAVKPGGGGGSALKIVLIVAGVLFIFGALSVGAMYYTAHHYIKIAEDVTGIKAGDALHSIREAATRDRHDSREAKRDGCLLLSKEEASAILGIEVIKVDGKVNEQQSGEHCDFFIKPGSIEQNLETLKQSTAAVEGDPGSGSKANELPPGSLDMIKNMARTAVETARNGEAPYFGYAVERENGTIVCSALTVAGRLSGVNAVQNQASEPLGVGDQAAMGIGESSLCVVKGSSAVTLDLTQVTSGRTKGIALAKTIVPRL